MRITGDSMKSVLYEAYREWREGMLALADDLDWEEQEASFAIWDAADHRAREDFNLFLASRALDQVSFSEMKQMEIQYDIEN